jgi:hypothetical protein
VPWTGPVHGHKFLKLGTPQAVGAGHEHLSVAREPMTMTQREMDIAEIVAAVRLLKRRTPVVWTCLREALERLERDDANDDKG